MTPVTPPVDAAPVQDATLTPPGESPRAFALVGLAVGVVALGSATLFAGLLTWLGLAGGTPSPVAAVGAAFVDRTPPWLKDFAVGAFGTNDKLALFAGMAVVLAAVFAGIGLVARHRHTVALVLLALVGAVGALAVLSRPDATGVDVVPTIAGTLVAMYALGWVRGAARRDGAAGSGMSRRGLLAAGGGLVAAVLGLRVTGSGGAAKAARKDVVLPQPALDVSLNGTAVGVDGVTPFVVPAADFYRIDTALVVPQLDTATWSLRVWGEVEQEVTIDWATLLGKPMQQHLVTLTCVSNEVGGNLAGNATWTGWPVRELLALAKPKPGADMVLSRSSDGFTAGTPIEALTDDRNALLAVGMNGEPLPFEHGFPARLVVPGLYGYVSATKWVTELKVTRFSADQGYWTPRGWSAKGPIKTASRIDVPKPSATVTAGPVAVAGVAWAQHRGVDRVELQVDDGPWQQARLAAEPTVDSWRQWVVTWDATAGTHTLRVRATDAAGAVQTEQEAPPDPDGATGYHTVQVTVS